MSYSLTSVLDAATPGPAQLSDEDFEAIRSLVYRVAGISLSDSKRALVCSRLARRLRDLNLKNHGEYLDYLANRDPDGVELQETLNCLTTNKTDFFREPHHFDYLRQVVFPQIERQASRGGPRRVRIWSAGCSMGDEPYSIAMELLDYPGFRRGWDIRILASDISTRVLKTAEEGVYPVERIEPVSPERQRRFFLRGTGTSAGLCQVRPELRRLIAFRRINFADSVWPVRTEFDVVFCRNVIIYFDLPTQQRVLGRLVDQIAPGGYLMLGHSESPQWLADVVSPLGKTMYHKAATPKAKVGSPVALAPPVRPEFRVPVSAPFRGSGPPAPVATAPQRATVRRPSIVRAPRTAIQSAPPRRNIGAGDVWASRDPVELTTVLGSCVAACLFDPETRIGGMNHFLLPCDGVAPSVSARYGIHAMELLINAIMGLGGDRRRLKAKVFGGANVLGFADKPTNVGQQNIEFIRQFLHAERIPLVAEHLGGTRAMLVDFRTATAQAFVKTIPNSLALSASEKRFGRTVAERLKHPNENNVTLF